MIKYISLKNNEDITDILFELDNTIKDMKNPFVNPNLINRQNLVKNQLIELPEDKIEAKPQTKFSKNVEQLGQSFNINELSKSCLNRTMNDLQNCKSQNEAEKVVHTLCEYLASIFFCINKKR